MRILACLIDDNKVFQIVTKRMLEKFPDKISDILQFYNGKDALDFFIKNKSNNDQLPDLVFLDLNMPILDGWGFLDELQKVRLSKHLKIYICTSSVSAVDTEKAKDYSLVDGYIVKPVNLDDLSEILGEYLNKEVG